MELCIQAAGHELLAQARRDSHAISNGWFYTGVWLRWTRRILLLSAQKDMIIIQQLTSIKRRVLFTHPAVPRPVSSAFLTSPGEAVKAFIVLKDGATASVGFAIIVAGDWD
jgi:hypothetical protein